MTTPSTIVVKSLLRAVEKLNRPLDRVNLCEICEKNKDLYGEAGTENRRQLQKWWYNVKRRSGRNYLRLLSSHRIRPSEATETWVREEMMVPSPPNSPVLDRESGLGNGGDDGSNSNRDGVASNLEQMFQEKLQIDSPDRPLSALLETNANASVPSSPSKQNRSPHVLFLSPPQARCRSESSYFWKHRCRCKITIASTSSQDSF